ncbi:MAG: hypothetical protein NMK33_03770 [Candidatus Cardinium sp.]|uniref:hypothetical protein n=1 Tax=Cardinium endosymbiont of Dermatophagoides farinae TaxID=2597823 RepID=UPI00164279DC|nr:hypothetical protein [Cardinium endosymbiont of Dermatophagoides farinae]UWW96550.1 MAG: hypothetical protein NMK33_03770 [Candidatus Cardinium sp.]
MALLPRNTIRKWHLIDKKKKQFARRAAGRLLIPTFYITGAFFDYSAANHIY